MKRLQELRQAAGLSQSQLAERAGMSVRSLQAYEATGDSARNFDGANVFTILKMCAALGCTLPEILEDQETRRLAEIVVNTQPKAQTPPA